MRKSSYDKIDKAFKFFQCKKSLNAEFVQEEIIAETGWSESTVKTYLTKKWGSFLTKLDNDKFEVNQRFDAFNLDSFRQHHSQKEIVSKFFYQALVDKAIYACISAIELYNKPDFKFREESFSILMTNAWELLLKAKILQNNDDHQDSIHISKKDGTIEISRSGNPKTISIIKALHLLESAAIVNKIVADNIRLLIEIRDEAVHFMNTDLKLCLKIQEIGTASIKNFMTLTMQWFGFDFNRYNFYLMPISFYHQADMESFSIDSQARNNLLNHLNTVDKEYEQVNDPNFSISLRVHTRLVKTDGDEHLRVQLSNDPDAMHLQISEEDALKGYPHSYSDLCRIFSERYTDFKVNPKFHSIKDKLRNQGERFAKERKLDPSNPNSISKIFYHQRIIDEFDKHYQRKKS